MALLALVGAVSLDKAQTTQSTIQVQSQAKTLQKLDAELKVVGDEAESAKTPEDKKAALKKLMKTYGDYHKLVLGYYGNVFNPLSSVPLLQPGALFNPQDTLADTIASETNDVYKQLKYIKGLEARLKGKKQGDTGTNETDFEMLSRLKKDLGMKVNFKTATEKREEERAERAGYTAPKE